MRKPASDAIGVGLRRIEGQIRGIQRMVEEDRYCIDLLVQMKAVRAGLLRLERAVLRDHVGSCVTEAFALGDGEEQRTKVDELVDAIGRLTR